MAKRYRCLTCQAMTVNAVDPKTGRKRLFNFHKDSFGELVAEFEKPHVCRNGGSSITEDDVRRIVQDEILGLNPKESEKAAAANKAASEELDSDGDEEPESASLTQSSNSAPRQSVDMTQVANIARQEVERLRAEMIGLLKPKVERIVVVRNADGSETLLKDEHTHPLFPRLLRYVAAGKNVYLYGAPGGGKSHAAAQSARALGLNYGYISLAPMTPESRILGFINVSGEYVPTEFFKCYTEGGVFCIDEMDNANDALLTALNGALENNRAAFPCGNRERHQNFVMVATGNTAGYGGTRGHAGRRAFDAATRERFAYIRWVYDETFEEALTLAKNPNAGAWLAWVRDVRAYTVTHALDVVVSPRASIVGAEMLKKGAVETAEELADATLFKGLEEVQRAKILSACPLPRLEVR